MITINLISTIRTQFRINWNGKHGIRHWARVYDIGMRLAQQTGANKEVVELFAVFHDSGRHNEHTDPGHGSRGAKLARQLYPIHFPSLKEREFELLHEACCLHTRALTHENITVQTCFDADRLDLGRVAKVPDPKLLCTDAAKEKEMIDWAYTRSREQEVPTNVLGKFIGQNEKI